MAAHDVAEGVGCGGCNPPWNVFPSKLNVSQATVLKIRRRINFGRLLWLEVAKNQKKICSWIQQLLLRTKTSLTIAENVSNLLSVRELRKSLFHSWKLIIKFEIRTGFPLYVTFSWIRMFGCWRQSSSMLRQYKRFCRKHISAYY